MKISINTDLQFDFADLLPKQLTTRCELSALTQCLPSRHVTGNVSETCKLFNLYERARPTNRRENAIISCIKLANKSVRFFFRQVVCRRSKMISDFSSILEIVHPLNRGNFELTFSKNCVRIVFWRLRVNLKMGNRNEHFRHVLLFHFEKRKKKCEPASA